jgi:hypothetical protein
MAGRALYHKELASAMVDYKGQELRAGEIKAIFGERYPDLRVDFVQASDHCDNHSNIEPCSCAKTEKALFHRLGWGRYRVL